MGGMRGPARFRRRNLRTGRTTTTDSNIATEQIKFIS